MPVPLHGAVQFVPRRSHRNRPIRLVAAAVAAMAGAVAKAQVYEGGVSQGESVTFTGGQGVTSSITTLGDGNFFAPNYGPTVPTGAIYLNDSDGGAPNPSDYFGANTVTMYGGSISYFSANGGSTTTIQNLNVATQGTLVGLPNNGNALLNIGSLTTSSTATMTFQSQYGNIGTSNSAAVQIGSLNGNTLTNNSAQPIGGWATVTSNGSESTMFASYGAEGVQTLTGTVSLGTAVTSTAPANTINVNDNGDDGGGLTANLDINSLVSNNNDVFLNGNLLTVESGGIIMGGNSHWIKSNGAAGTITAGAGGGYNLFVTVNESADNFQFNNVSVVDNGSNAVSFVKGGIGKLQLNAQSTFSGNLVVNEGILQLDVQSGTGTLAGNGQVIINAGATLLSGTTDGLGYYNHTTNNGVFINEGGTLSVVSNSRLSMDRNITSVGGTIASQGGGDGAGSYDLRDSQGALYSFTSASDGTPSTISATNFGLQGDVTFNVTQGGGPVDLNVNGSLENIYNNTGTIIKTGNGVMELSGTLANTNINATVSSGTLILAKTSSSAVHAIDNFLTISGGTVQLGGTGGDQIADTAGVTLNSGTFDLNGNSETIDGLSGGSGNLTNTGTQLSTLTVGAGGSSTVFGGSITDGNSPLALVKTGSGTLQVYGQSTFSGNITVSAGTLAVATFGNASTGALGNTATQGRTITIEPGATLNLTSNDVFGNGAGLGTALVANGGTITAARYNGIGNVQLLNGGTLTQNSTDGSGTDAYQGYQFEGSITADGTSATTISNGSNNAGDHLGSNTLFDVVGTGGALTVSAPLINQSNNFGQQPGALTMSGAGVLVFQAASTYSGGTTISSGTLRANNTGGSATGSGSITLGAGASSYGGGRLGGSGTVTGAVTLSSSNTAQQGGVITAGQDDATTGVLNTGAQTWNDGAAYQVKFAAAGNTSASGTGASQTPGVGTNDALDISGGLTVNSGANAQPFTIALTSIASLSGAVGTQYSWTIAQVSGATTLTNGVAVSPDSGATTANLLTASPNSGSTTLFALDTSGFTFNGGASSPSSFSLEFVGTGSGDNLVLDYTAAPEPGTVFLTLAGLCVSLARRRRRRVSSGFEEKRSLNSFGI